MPMIPQFSARTDVGSAPRQALMDVNSAASSGQAMAQLGQNVSQLATEVQQREKKARQATQLASAQTQAMRKLSDLRMSFDQDTDFATQRQRFQSEARKAWGEIGAGLDPDVRQAFMPDFEQMSLSHELDVAKQARRGEQDNALATLATMMNDSAKQYGSAGNELQQRAISESVRQSVMRYADSGLIDRTKAVELTQNWMKDASRENLVTLAMTNPDMVAQRIEQHFGMPTTPVGFEANVQAVLKREGGFVANDAGAGATNFGINSAANPDVNVADLTQAQAVDLYKSRYWDAIGADLLPPTAQAIAFDAAVNQGVGYAKDMIARTGGDPQKMLADRAARYQQTAAADPSKAPFLEAWNNRLKEFSANGRQNDDPLLSNLDPSEAFTVYRTAAQTIKQRQQEAEQARSAQQARFQSDFEIGLNRGEKTYADIEQAYQAGQITPSDRTRYTLAIDKQIAEGDSKQQMIARVDNAGSTAPLLDPSNADDRKALNYHYQQTATQWADLSPDQVVTQAINYANDKGIVPEPMQGMVRGMLRGGDVQQRVLAADTVQRLRQANPLLLNDFADKDIALANSISLYTSLGMTPADATSKALQIEQMNPQEKAALSDGYAAELRATAWTAAGQRDANKNWLNSNLPKPWFTTNPVASQSMVTDFEEATKQAYMLTGNLEAARKTALDQLNRVYGESRVNGTVEMMKFAPETFFGNRAMSVSANAAWIREQLEQKLTENAVYNEGFAKSLRMVPYGFAAANGLPQYSITNTDESGVVRVLTGTNGRPLLYQPDWSTSAEAKRQEEARQKLIEDARRRASDKQQMGPLLYNLGEGLKSIRG